MSFRRVVLIALVALSLAVLSALGMKQIAAAQAAVVRAEVALEQTVRDAVEVLELRLREERIAARPRPQEHLIAQVNVVLAEVGIPSRQLRSVQPESDTAVTLENSETSRVAGENGLRRQSVAISLQQLTVAALGDLLLRWREAHPTWTTSRIELLKHRGDSAATFDVTIVVSATYLGET